MPAGNVSRPDVTIDRNQGSSVGITEMLIDWADGDQNAFDDLYPLIHAELRRLARYYLRTLRPGGSFQTTVLINEAYIRLVDQRRIRWQNRSHFFGIAARMMRRILLNSIRDQKRQKRGGGAMHITLEDVAVVSKERSNELLALDQALTRLEEIEPRKAQVVELRFYGGLGVRDVADTLGVSRITVIRDWNFAKAWLARELAK
jgi:RNA polymerase sigma-70 factor, ECF subfamily